MNNSLLAVSAILLPFAFKILQVLKDKKQRLKEIDERYNQFEQEKSSKNDLSSV